MTITRTPTKPSTLPRRYKPGWLRELDQRSEISRRLNATYDDIVAEAGGTANLSRVKLGLIERYVFLDAMLQTWEAELATKPAEADKIVGRWIQAVNSLQGLAKLIGMERRATTMDLNAYLARKAAEDAA